MFDRSIKLRSQKKFVPRGPVTKQGLGFKSSIPEYKCENNDGVTEEMLTSERIPGLGKHQKHSYINTVDKSFVYRGRNNSEIERRNRIRALFNDERTDKWNEGIGSCTSEISSTPSTPKLYNRTRSDTRASQANYDRTRSHTRASQVNYDDKVTDDVSNLIRGIEREDKLTRRAKAYHDEITDSIDVLTDSLDQFIEKSRQRNKRRY